MTNTPCISCSDMLRYRNERGLCLNCLEEEKVIREQTQQTYNYENPIHRMAAQEAFLGYDDLAFQILESGTVEEALELRRDFFKSYKCIGSTWDLVTEVCVPKRVVSLQEEK